MVSIQRICQWHQLKTFVKHKAGKSEFFFLCNFQQKNLNMNNFFNHITSQHTAQGQPKKIFSTRNPNLCLAREEYVFQLQLMPENVYTNQNVKIIQIKESHIIQAVCYFIQLLPENVI